MKGRLFFIKAAQWSVYVYIAVTKWELGMLKSIFKVRHIDTGDIY